MVVPMFELTKKYVIFQWNLNYQKVFEQLKQALVFALILVQPNFSKVFILDVNWSTKGVGAILSQKYGRKECVIT